MPDRLAVAPQDAGAQRVERPRLDVLAGVADEVRDPLPELARGAVGERDREDPVRPDRLDADEVRDPVGDDARLARPGPGEDEQRALGRRDRPGLLRVHPRQDLLGAGLAARLDRLGGVLGRDRGPGVRRRPARRAPRAASRARRGSRPRQRGAASPGGCRRLLLAGPRSSHVPCPSRLRLARAGTLRGVGRTGWGSPAHSRCAGLGASPGPSSGARRRLLDGDRRVVPLRSRRARGGGRSCRRRSPRRRRGAPAAASARPCPA